MRPEIDGKVVCFFFNDTATTEIYTLSLHDALPICSSRSWAWARTGLRSRGRRRRSDFRTRGSKARTSGCSRTRPDSTRRSEEHTSELQSRQYLVCRLLLEKKKT